MEEDRSLVHLTMAVLGRLLRGELSKAESEQVIAHVEAGCEDCAVLLAPLVLGLLDPAKLSARGATRDEPDAYDLPVGRALRAARAVAAALAGARIEVRRQLIQILAFSNLPESPVRSPEWRWAWCELLLEAGRVRRVTDLTGAAELIQIAVIVSEQLEGENYPREALADLRARAWAELGNIRRILNDLDGAEEAFAEACERYEKGSTAPLLLARILDLLGSLLYDQRRFSEALEALGGAYRLYLDGGEKHMAGRVLIVEAVTEIHAGEPQAAIGALRRALPLLDLSREPALALATVQNALLALVDAGHADSAASLLWRCRQLYATFGSPLDRVRLLGLEAKIAAAQGQSPRAERLFREVIAAFEDEGLPYDVALVSLELAVVLLALGRTADVLALVDDMLEIFRAHGIRREAFMTVLTLREAVEQGTATAQLVKEVADRLRRLDEGPAVKTH